MADLLLLLLFPAIVIYSAVSDLLRMTISNRVSIGLAVAFLVAAFVAGMPLALVGWHLAAGAVVLAITFTCFAFGWIGGGDAKIAAATALWLGFDLTLSYIFIGSILGGLLTLALLKARTYPLPAIARKHAWIVRLHDEKTGIPYGIALAAAALIVYPQTSWMLSLGSAAG
jgi:prepilin peptidase CpaA